MSKARTALVLTALTALGPALAACANVLGIDAARHDVSLDHAGTGGGSGAGGGGNDIDAAKTLCERYCDTVMANCTGDNPVYRSRTICDSVCATLPPGQPGDTSGNTVECRLHFAELAATLGEPTLNCPAAGPGGDGLCGENCEGFCTIALNACPNSPVSGIQCDTICAKLPDPGGYTSNMDTGNTIECRLYHASAATFDPDNHCKHVAGVGACLP